MDFTYSFGVEDTAEKTLMLIKGTKVEFVDMANEIQETLPRL